MMKPINNPSGFKQTAEIYRGSLQLLTGIPTILVLFLAIASLDVVALTCLYYAPSKPISLFLAPIIRTFWGERFLHYPENFILLPKLFSYAHFVILTLFGILISGIVIKQIQASYLGKKLGTLEAAGDVFKSYFALLLVWLASTFIWRVGLTKLFQMVHGPWWVQMGLLYLTALFFQSVVTFIFPALLIQRQNFLKDSWQGIQFGFRNLPFTAALIAVPVFIVFIISLVKSWAPILVRYYPESVLWILSIGIVISLIVDMLITSMTTLYFLKARNVSYAKAN